jgi:hypothetical protein
MARRAVGAGLVLAFLAGFAVADGPEDAAQAAGEAWLRVIDAGDYAGSWNQASKALKGTVKQADWVELSNAARAPLGPLVSRKLKSREYTEKPPTTRLVGGRVYTWGQGKYVVLRYEASFANRASASETVTMMADSDGAWRASGYTVP